MPPPSKEVTITLDQTDPHHGDTITFTVDWEQDDLGPHEQSYLTLNCFQTVSDDQGHTSDTWVFTASTGYGWGMYPDGGLPFTLHSEYWTEGPAKGHAEFRGLNMQNGKQGKVLGTLEFNILA